MLGAAAGGPGLRARERQVHGGAFRWERQVPDEGGWARRAAAGAEGRPTLDTALGVLRWIPKGYIRLVEHHGHRVIWVPARADSLKRRLLVCAHLEGAGHREVDATMAWLERHRVWEV